MTPLEKAARETWKLREQYMWPDRARRPVPDDIDYASGAFAKVETETRAIITAFLEAAAEDEASVERGREIIANGCGCHRDCDGPESDGYCGCRLESKAAILALKETING